MYKFLFYILFLISASGAFSNGKSEELLTKANQAYLQEQYSHAAEIYEEVRAMNLESASLYYNLANAYFKDGNYGKAILNYERALRLSPGDENTIFNLRVVQSRIVDKVSPVPTIFYVKWWQGFYSLFSINNWGWMVIFSLVLVMVCLGFYFFASARKTKILAFVGAMAFLMLMLVSNLAARTQYYNNHKKMEGIILLPRVAAKSSPADTSPELFVVHEGSKTLITNELSEWYEIRLANGNVGWVKKSSLEVI